MNSNWLLSVYVCVCDTSIYSEIPPMIWFKGIIFLDQSLEILAVCLSLCLRKKHIWIRAWIKIHWIHKPIVVSNEWFTNKLLKHSWEKRKAGKNCENFATNSIYLIALWMRIKVDSFFSRLIWLFCHHQSRSKCLNNELIFLWMNIINIKCVFCFLENLFVKRQKKIPHNLLFHFEITLYIIIIIDSKFIITFPSLTTTYWILFLLFFFVERLFVQFLSHENNQNPRIFVKSNLFDTFIFLALTIDDDQLSKMVMF